jgi:DNA-binding MarR family transcriptional regulator
MDVTTARKLREPRAVRLGRSIHLNILLLGNRSSEQMDEICRESGLTHPQYVALFTLCLTDDPEAGLPIGAVADGLLNRASDTTRLIDRMERAGLVERLRNPDDRRGVLVRPTRKGQKAFAEITPKTQALHRRQWSHLSAEEATQLDHLLGKALWGEN